MHVRTLIIGATGSIGTALAHQLAARGQPLCLSGRNIEKLTALAKMLNAVAVPADLADESQVAALLAQAGELDLLIYAAGCVERVNLRQMTLQDWQRVIDANLTGAFLVLKHARFRRNARAVFIGVYPELLRVKGLSAYAVSKAGLEALLNNARREMRVEGVHLILVRMPEVATDLWSVFGGAPKRALCPDDAAQKLLDAVFTEPCPEVVEIARPR